MQNINMYTFVSYFITWPVNAGFAGLEKHKHFINC